MTTKTVLFSNKEPLGSDGQLARMQIRIGKRSGGNFPGKYRGKCPWELSEEVCLGRGGQNVQGRNFRGRFSGWGNVGGMLLGGMSVWKMCWKSAQIPVQNYRSMRAAVIILLPPSSPSEML